MSSFTSLSAEVHFIETELAPAHRSASGRRTPSWIGRATVALVVGSFVLGIASGVIDSVRERQRKQCSDRLTRIGLALHEYQNAHNHFPAPTIFNGDGAPLLRLAPDDLAVSRLPIALRTVSL